MLFANPSPLNLRLATITTPPALSTIFRLKNCKAIMQPFDSSVNESFSAALPIRLVLDVAVLLVHFFIIETPISGEYEILGTDVSGAPLDYAESKGVPVLRGDFLAQDFGEEKFDAITLWAVLEHLQEPKRFLQKAAAL